jgi:hypothetical protein
MRFVLSAALAVALLLGCSLVRPAQAQIVTLSDTTSLTAGNSLVPSYFGLSLTTFDIAAQTLSGLQAGDQITAITIKGQYRTIGGGENSPFGRSYRGNLYDSLTNFDTNPFVGNVATTTNVMITAVGLSSSGRTNYEYQFAFATPVSYQAGMVFSAFEENAVPNVSGSLYWQFTGNAAPPAYHDFSTNTSGFTAYAQPLNMLVQGIRSTADTPEPSTLALLAPALPVVGTMIRRRQRKA